MTSIHLETEASLVGWTLRFKSRLSGPMNLPFTLRFHDGDMILDAALLGTDQFPVRHVWMDSPGGATNAWLRHLGTPAQALTEPFDGTLQGGLDKQTELVLVEAARARFLGAPGPRVWPEGLPEPEILGARECRIRLIPESAVSWCHPATAPLGLNLDEEPLVELVPESDCVTVAVPAATGGIEVAAALITAHEVLSSRPLSPAENSWTATLPLYWQNLEEVHLDVFDPQVGVGLPAESRPAAWAALREFASGYWRAELPDREQSELVIPVRNGLGESFEVWPSQKRSGSPAIRRLALVELRCGWFGEDLDPGACAVDRALAFAGLNDSASAAQSAMGEGVEWLLHASAEAADGSWPQIQGELRRACESLSDLVDQRLADVLRARGELLAARPDLDDELAEILKPEPARVLGIPSTAFGKGRQWVQGRQDLLAQDWDGDEPDRPLLAEWWAAEGRP